MSNIAIIGLQWGDEGKGKIVDFLADKFDAVVRLWDEVGTIPADTWGAPEIGGH